MIEIGADFDYYNDGLTFRKPRMNRHPIQWRKLFRLFFRLSLIGLIVGSCTQSVSWLGEMSTRSSRRYIPNYYQQNSYQYQKDDRYDYNSRRSSTRYNEYQQPIEEDEYNESYKY